MLPIVDTVEEFWTDNDIEKARRRVGSGSQDAFRQQFADFLDVPSDYAYILSSGHEALRRILLGRNGDRPVVLAPAFNCSVVESAIRGAGFELDTYDFSIVPGLFDWDEVLNRIDDSVDTIIVTHYFGVPVDFNAIIDSCKAKNIAIIEDCAHTLGGMIHGRFAGRLGDAAIFSFNYDKPISLGWGGAGVINNEKAFPYISSLEEKVESPSLDDEIELFNQFLNWRNRRRQLIPVASLWKTRLLRRIGKRRTLPLPAVQNVGMGAFRAELGQLALDRYNKIQSQRNKNADRLTQLLPNLTWPVGTGVEPSWVKQKIRIESVYKLNQITKQLQKSGIRAGNFNWRTLIGTDDKFVDPRPFAYEVATKWIDVPIHQNVTDKHLDTIAQMISKR